MPEMLLQMTAISKAFPGVQALNNVDLTVHAGEIMALVGENGAGKSTLMRVLNGVFPADGGEIIWQGRPVSIRSPHDAQALGIGMIHQELALIPYLDVGKNLFLGREPKGSLPGTVNWRALYEQAQRELDRLGLDINPRTPVRRLAIAQQQMVEVVKALSLDARLIVMDEPTSSLTDREVEMLFRQMRALREQGVGVVFISHRLEEVFEIADRVTVLRDGLLVGAEPVGDLTPEKIIRMMVGRELGDVYGEDSHRQPEVVLAVENLAHRDAAEGVSFELHKGEILGVAGLMGAGRTEMAETIFGVRPATSGHIRLNGQPVAIRRPAQAIRHGIGLVPEDRKAQGLFLRMTVTTNVVMALFERLARWGLISWPRAEQIAGEFVRRLDIRTPSLVQRVRNLSGGNQQKVVIAKWLTLEPKVLILDEPTRGIDVGAKAEIYRLMNQLAERGVGILMISSDLPEVLGVSDRVLVMHEGRIAGTFDPAAATQDDIMGAAMGAANEQNAASRTGGGEMITVRRALFINVLRRGTVFLILLALVVFFSLTSDRFLQGRNLTNILIQNAHVIVVTIGMTLTMLAGGIDLSVGSVAAFAGAVSAGVIVRDGLPVGAGMAVGLGVGLGLGIVNGLLIVYGKLPPFVATLAMLGVARGLTLVYTEGEPIAGMGDDYTFFSRGKIGLGLQMGEAINLASPVPAPIVVWVVVLILAWLLLTQTRFGLHIYAIGGNEETTRLAGVSVNRVKVMTYGLSGLLAGVAGLLLTARVYSAQPQAGVALELDAIAASVLGGVSLFGGVGNVLSAVVGALIVGVLSNGMNLLRVASYPQQVIQGVVLVLAVTVDMYTKRFEK